jgi:CYTH domain-containing protein
MPKYSRIERERRHLLPSAPERAANSTRIIIDLYVANSTLRLRKIENPDGTFEYKFGQKKAIDAYRREMTTLYITHTEFELLSVLPGKRLVKERYPFTSEEGVNYEINVFRGENEGLVLAEIEFDTDEGLRAHSSAPSEWIEVTDDARYDGGNLAR